MQTAKIEMKGLAFFARHGALSEEAALGQRFWLDVVAALEGPLELAQDAPSATVNYVELYELVERVFTGQRFNLIEAAADTIAVAALEQFPRIASMTVKVKKPSVPVDCVCEYFAAEVTRCR